MAKKIDRRQRSARSLSAVESGLDRWSQFNSSGASYLLLRWAAAMTAVELHAIWERYAEDRLSTALNHDAAYFLTENGVKGVKQVSSGLAVYIVRGGGRFFDFRSMEDLVKKADRILGNSQNPFRVLSKHECEYLDTLAAIRNCVVHGSEQAHISYRKYLKKTYGIRTAPGPEEFLKAIDYRPTSPARYKTRLQGLGAIVDGAIRQTS